MNSQWKIHDQPGPGFGYPLLLLGILLWAVPVLLAADALDQLPPPWQSRLQAVPEADLSATERIAREAINGTRSRLADLLQNSAADSANLAEGYGRLAALYQFFDIDAAAALCWENARKLQPEEFHWSYYAGYLALTTGQTENALALLQRARELDPDYAPLNLRMGQLWLESERPEQARAALQQAVSEPGLRAAALYYLGQLDLLGRDYPSAAKHFSEALTIQPEATSVHYALAQAYRHLGKQDLARQHLAQFKVKLPGADDPLLSELESIVETSRSAFRLGMRAFIERDYQSAIEHFSEGLKLDPDNLAARVTYARNLYLGGQTDAAQQQLQVVLERDPEQAQANFFLAVLWQSQDKLQLAADRYHHILQRDPQHEGASFYLANLLFQQDRFSEAAEYYEAALAASRDVPPARLLQVIAQHRAGRPDQELALQLEKWIEEYPDEAALKYALIRLRCLSADARVRDSVRALSLANQLAPAQPNPPNVEALALAAAADGQFDQAARLQQQVIDMLGWMATPQQVETVRKTLDAYQEGAMPQQPIWPTDDVLLSPRPLDPVEPFRDYPAAVPF